MRDGSAPIGEESRLLRGTGKEQRGPHWLPVAGLAVAAAAFAFVVLSLRSRVTLAVGRLSAFDTQRSLSGLTFTASNEYTSALSNSLYPWLEGFKLVEPHRDTTLAVKYPLEGMVYSWTVSDNVGAETKLLGSSVVHQFSDVGWYTVKLEETELGLGTAAGRPPATRSLSERVSCKHVRREIRTLTETDRNELLDAMATLWHLPTDAGRAIYGPLYTDISGLVAFHHRGAASRTCDSFHDGLGFLVSHILTTNLFEEVLQIINPKISLPYWDYTIEDYVIKTQFDGLYTRLQEASPLFRPSWFGSADKHDFIVKDGRWAWTKALMVSQEQKASGMAANIYGQMRGPWTMGSSPYLTRGMGNACGDFTVNIGHKWASCQDHYDLLQMDSYYDFAYFSELAPHGGVHVFIGGLNECEHAFDQVEALVGEVSAQILRSRVVEERKNFYKWGYWDCVNETAPSNATLKEVMTNYCGCNQAGYSTDDPGAVATMLASTYVAEAAEGWDTETQRQVAHLLCTATISAGDNIQSASPLDPIFWMVHPVMERLVQYKLASETLDLSTWISKGFTQVNEDGTETTFEVSINGDDCIGHRPDDVWPYGLVDEDVMHHFNNDKGPNTLTNLEAFQLLDPAKDVMPYIYDNFEWPHCELQDIHLSDVLRREGGL